MGKALIACCGLDCEKCDARIATVNEDTVLREKTARLWTELNQVPITADMICCMGCRTEGVKTPFCDSMCQIRKCVQKKGFATCGDCGELEHCAIVGEIIEHDAAARQRLQKKEAGV